MSEVRIKAETRTEFGKGGARRTRRAGNVPAVLYGHGTDPQHIALPAREFAAAIRHGGINQLFTIEGTDGTETLALPKAIQRNPVRDSFEHIDLLIVRRGEKVTVDVPVTLTGEIAPEGLLDQQLIQISVQAEATNIPPGIEISVEGMAVGDSVHARDLTLPQGVTLDEEPDALVLHVIAAPTAAQLEAELGVEEEAAEAEAPAAEAAGEAAEAAPAAEDAG